MRIGTAFRAQSADSGNERFYQHNKLGNQLFNEFENYRLIRTFFSVAGDCAAAVVNSVNIINESVQYCIDDAECRFFILCQTDCIF